MDKVLGGDIIVEQNIHVIDMANWYIGAHPIQANGAGGRTDWTGTDLRHRRRLRSLSWFTSGIPATYKPPSVRTS